MTEYWAIVLVILAGFTGSMTPIWLKRCSTLIHWNPKTWFHGDLFKALVGSGISMVLVTIAFRGGELSILYPFASLSFVWTALLSQKLLGERISRSRWIGIGLILIGVWLIGFTG